jgi:putative ABC transport system ATP-binding protein
VSVDAGGVVRAERVERTLGEGDAARAVLRGMSLTVARGEWVAIMGASGSGKSTLLHLLGGLDRPDAGSLEVAGVDVVAASQGELAELRRRHLAYVFQQYNLLSDLDALSNVALPLRLQGVRKRAARRRAVDMLAALGLEDRAGAHPARLSGGEQQRVAIARALVIRPTVLLADEPTGALDSESAKVVLDTLDAQHREGQTIVMVTHDHRVAVRAQRILTMRDGRVGDEHRLSAVADDDLPHLVRLDPTS